MLCSMQCRLTGVSHQGEVGDKFRSLVRDDKFRSLVRDDKFRTRVEKINGGVSYQEAVG